jgi:hypothetical protein
MLKALKSPFLVLLFCLTACDDSQNPPLSDGAKISYRPSKANSLPMVFPGKYHTTYVKLGNKPISDKPAPYSHSNEWVVYMASPGWTNGGTDIVDRLAMDAVAIDRVKQFILNNQLHGKVKVAWLQYDQNPPESYYGPMGMSPGDFIPVFLRPHGPNADYYIYSPASRFNSSISRVAYDQWLKPYLPFAKKTDLDYVAATEFQFARGFNYVAGPYWDNWSRHWFIVDPDGIVVDAYFSNLGFATTKGAEFPISSLIYHFKLSPDKLELMPFKSLNYTSTFTKPYWEQITSVVIDEIVHGDGK